MEGTILVVVSVSILLAAVIGSRSGIATAFLEILAGVLIGNFFDFSMNEFLTIMAELGLITLMFMAGLEVDFQFLKSKAKESISVGIISYVIPFIIVFGAGLFLFELSQEQAMLYAIALSTSSAGIVYPILRQKGPLGPRRKMILSAVMVMEFISMMLLGFLYTDLTLSVVLVILFIAIVGLSLPRLQKRFHVFRDGTQENLAIKVVLVLLIISQFLSHESGIDVILIVFVLGMFLADFVQQHQTLKKEVEAIGFGFLTPIFFFTVGLSISVPQLLVNAWEVGTLVAISFIATFAATYVIAKKHFPSRARVMAFIFNAPLSVGIVAATVGREKEVISSEQFGVLVGAVVIISLVAAVFGKYPIQNKKRVEA